MTDPSLLGLLATVSKYNCGTLPVWPGLLKVDFQLDTTLLPLAVAVAVDELACHNFLACQATMWHKCNCHSDIHSQMLDDKCAAVSGKFATCKLQLPHAVQQCTASDCKLLLNYCRIQMFNTSQRVK